MKHVIALSLLLTAALPATSFAQQRGSANPYAQQQQRQQQQQSQKKPAAATERAAVTRPGRASTQPAKAAQRDLLGRGYDYVRLSDGQLLRVGYISKLIYLGRSAQLYTGFLRFSAYDRASGEEVLPVEGFLKVGGKPKKIHVTSSDEKVLSLEPNPQVGTFYTFNAPGQVHLAIAVGEQEVARLDVEVVKLSIAEDASSDSVVEKLGLPDHRKAVFVSWPKTEDVDDVYYEAQAGQSVRADHWRWDDHPGLVVAIQGGKVGTIRTSPQRPFLDEIQEMQQWLAENP
jgi:hypothetical protein